MASTYSTNLSLELPGTGDQSGTWGTTANRDMGTLLEQAISGFVEQQFNTDADITLTILSGADGGGNVTPGIIYGTSTPGTAASPVSARNMYIKCTGTLTAARTLTVPTNRKLYYIYNNTTGGYALTVKTAAGTGISVPNGSKMLLVCDGTNIVESINYFSSLTFNSLTVTGNVTLSGGTANGVAYLNGSKVVTTGTGLTFDGTNLGIGTSSPISRVHSVAASDGSISLQLTSGTGDTSNGQYTTEIRATSSTGTYFQNLKQQANIFQFYTLGSERMRLDSSGNLGVGTSSPAQRLDVTGAVNTVQARFGNVTGRGLEISTALVSGTNDAGSVLNARGATSGTLIFQTDSTERMRLDSSGNLGLGATPSAWGAGRRAIQISSPAQVVSSDITMEIGSNWYNDGTNYRYTASNAASLYSPSSGQHAWYIASSGTAGNAISFTQAMTLDSSGNLGIGTTTPGVSLDVNGSARIQNSLFVYGSGDRFNVFPQAAGSGAQLVATNNANSAYAPMTLDGTPLVFNVAGAERMRLDSSGYLGIGTASPLSKLEVNGGYITAGTVASSNGSKILAGNYSAGAITTFGSEYSSGGPVIGYGVWPSTSAPDAFISSSSFTLYRGAYTIDSGNHKFYSGTVQTVAIGSPVSVSETMRLNSSGNLGIGTASPTARLDVRGPSGIGIQIYETSTGNNNRLIITQSDTVSTYNSTYSTGSAVQAWQLGGTEFMRLATSSGNALLGIGQNNPQTALSFGNTSTISWGTSNYPYISGNNASNYLTFGTQAAERMRIDGSGNVGIGTTPNSGFKLDVVGSGSTIVRVKGGAATNQGAAFYVTSAGSSNTLVAIGDRASIAGGTPDQTASIYTYTNIPLTFDVSGTTKATIDASGSLLINNVASSFAEKLSVLGTGATTTPTNLSSLAGSLVLVKSAQAGTSYGGVGYNDSGGGGAAVVFGRGSSYDTNIGFYTNPSSTTTAGAMTQRMVIDSSGNLLVGTTDPAPSSGQGVKLLPTGRVYSVITSSIADSYDLYNTTAAAYRFYVDNAGTIFATSTTISAISDIRLKENVRDLDAGLGAILALKPRRFDWKAGKGKDVRDDMGFIAQEVETVLPELIGGWKAGEGEPDDLKSVKAGDLIPVLVKAIQELTARVAQLEGR